MPSFLVRPEIAGKQSPRGTGRHSPPRSKPAQNLLVACARPIDGKDVIPVFVKSSDLARRRLESSLAGLTSA